MNQDEFVKAIKIAVYDAAIEAIKATLTQPAGRTPNIKIKALSQWFNSLSENEMSNVEEIVRLASHAATFNFLCVFDDVRAIETTSSKGRISVSFIKDGKTTCLNSPQGELLHDIYQSLVQTEVFGKR